MKGKAKRESPEIVIRDGEPVAVILDIDEYREILERLEDMEDLKTLEEMRSKPLQFRRLDDFLKEYRSVDDGRLAPQLAQHHDEKPAVSDY
jgi:PHD/YefM family antitoxin component YafN of YafNO toxin-antitoxin module